MYDKQAVLDILQQTHEAILRIARRSEPIIKVEDFTNSEDGIVKIIEDLK